MCSMLKKQKKAITVGESCWKVQKGQFNFSFLTTNVSLDFFVFPFYLYSNCCLKKCHIMLGFSYNMDQSLNQLISQSINCKRKYLNPCAFSSKLSTLCCKFASLATFTTMIWSNESGPFVNDRNEEQSRTEYGYWQEDPQEDTV